MNGVEITRQAGLIVSFLDSNCFGADDAEKRAVFKVATEAHSAKIERETTPAVMRMTLNHFGR